MRVEYLVKEIAPVVGGQLRVPDQPADLPDPHGPDRVAAVVHAKTRLEINGILPDLLLDQKDNLLLLQQGAQVYALQIGAKDLPIRIVEVNMVFTAHVLAFAHIVGQIL